MSQNKIMNNFNSLQDDKINNILIQDIDNYINIIQSKCIKYVPIVKKSEKISVSGENIYIPKINEYNNIYGYNYNLQHLKSIAKIHKLKISGNKEELLKRLFCFFRLSTFAIKIQKLFRGSILRNYIFYHGPAVYKREKCINQSDFLTMEELKDLNCCQFFSYEDTDGFIYGFDVISLYNLIIKNKPTPKNPYNRMDIPENVFYNIKKFIRLSRILKFPVNLNINDISDVIPLKKTLELRILDLFQNIDSLGNYSNAQWFLSLNRFQLFRFMSEIVDIWNYRAQISIETKRSICPPLGEPFRNLSLINMNSQTDLDIIRKIILEVLEKLVNTGVDRDSRTLGSYYVLGALTLVNDTASQSLPWLYQSFSYF
jgi:hypothetical protein